MNKIHKYSELIPLADFDFFEIPPTQNTIEQSYVSEHRPISQLRSDGIIEFQVNSSVDEYILLRDTMLYLRLKVDITNKDGKDVQDGHWNNIGPVNNLFHSLFQTIDIEINGKSITKSPQTYAYKALFDNIFGFTSDALKTHMTSQGYIYEKDKTQLHGAFKKLIKPANVLKSGEGKTIDLMGKLNLDIAMQPKALLGGLKMKFLFKINKPEFYMWNTTGEQIPKVTFEAATLFVAKVKVNPTVVEAHNRLLAKDTAKYPITRGEVKSYAIAKDLQDVNIDNLITGQLPRRIFIAMVKNKAFTGDLMLNPYNFEHFDLNFLSACINGKHYPASAFQPDFSNGLYVREYLSVYEALNQITTDTVYSCSKSDYTKGNVIFGINFGQDTCEDIHKAGYVNPVNIGSINFHLQFKNVLPEPINLLVYCEFDNIVEIDINRNAITDFV